MGTEGANRMPQACEKLDNAPPPPSQTRSMNCNACWVLKSSQHKEEPLFNAHRGAAASAENYRYHDAQLGMVSGKCVKMFGPGCLER